MESIQRGPHKSRIALVKYEDLYNNPMKIVSSVFSQLKLPMTDRTIEYIKANIMNEKGGDLDSTSEHGFFTKPRDKNTTIGLWKSKKISPQMMKQSEGCVQIYENTKSSVLE